MVRNGSRQWESYLSSANPEAEDSPKQWSQIKADIKNAVLADRKKLWSDYIKPLVKQGEVLKLIELESCDLTWRSIIYDMPQKVLSFAVRASIDFLPTMSNLKTWGKRTTDVCKHCGNRETLNHVLNSCKVYLDQGIFTWRHTSIIHHLLAFIREFRPEGEVFADVKGLSIAGVTIPPEILCTNLKPDIVLVNRSDKNIDIFELSVPFEPNIGKAHIYKSDKYDLQSKGYSSKQFCV
ncbi:uncharacterized protein LOC117103291 [Anneissia japonica]|uniref:uncharacterized protein LOC117103291 n=1 Tax=Anneissia japonica TaxID=1529436 RepID=UPI001425580B|nr:uncharacterized protein LOC117103291 [Anneissia japonica]